MVAAPLMVMELASRVPEILALPVMSRLSVGALLPMPILLFWVLMKRVLESMLTE
jgi:hypothetical protein